MAKFSGCNRNRTEVRVPDNRAGALQDAQRALALIRSRAGEWNIDPERLGIMGFSAGGHLAAVTAAKGTKRPTLTSMPSTSRARPQTLLLIYPAYLTDKAGTLSEQFSDLSSYPPTFIAGTQDDKLFTLAA